MVGLISRYHAGYTLIFCVEGCSTLLCRRMINCQFNVTSRSMSRFINIYASCQNPRSCINIIRNQKLCTDHTFVAQPEHPRSTIIKHKYIPRRHAKRLQAYEKTHSVIHKSILQPSTVLKIDEDMSNARICDMLENAESSVRLEHEPFPSDIDEIELTNNQYRDQSRHAYKPAGLDINKASILIFPGQGSQFVGMGAKLLQYPNVVELFDAASQILGYDLLKLCLNGPKEILDKTVHCQPAIVVTSLAAIEMFKHDNPEVLENCMATAGFSVGEYSALVFAEAMSFEDAVTVIKVRGEAMQEASEMVESGMMSVFTSAASRLPFGMLTAREYCKSKGIDDPVCQVANYLYPQCKVIAGHTMALNFLHKHAAEFGLRRIKELPVSGAFHTDLMLPAKEKLIRVLKKIELRRPKVCVYSNVTSHRHQKSTLVKDLARQVHKPVKWEQILHVLYTRQQGEAFPLTYEVGPGKQLGAVLRLVNAKAHERYHSVLI